MHYDKTCDCTQGLLLADYLKSLPTGTNLPPDRAAQARADNSRFLNQFAPDHTLCDLVGNPPDAPNLPASLDHHRAALGCAPAVLAADRAFSTSTNESIAEAHGVSWIALPPAGPTQSDAQPNLAARGVSDRLPIPSWNRRPQQRAAFGVFLILMFWLYLPGWVIVIGVEINAFLDGSN